MGRRSSKQVKRDNLSQRQLRRLERKKKNSNPRKDSKDWTTNFLGRLQNNERDE